MSIPSPATRHAWDARSWATAARSVSPRSPVRSSMSEAGKPARAPKGDPREAAKAEKKAAKKSEKSAGTKVAVGETSRDPNYVPRFKQRYNEVIRPALMKEFGYENVLQVPRIQKIVLNIGAGEAASDSKKIQQA